MASKKKNTTGKKSAKKDAAKAKKQAKKAADKAKSAAKKAKKKAVKAKRTAKKAAKKHGKKGKNLAKAVAPVLTAAPPYPPSTRTFSVASSPVPPAEAAPAEATITALRAKARELGIPNYSRLTKAELVERISAKN